MTSGQEPIRVGRRPPFAVPPERRDPARRWRGRLVAPGTVWTAGQLPGAGLPVSSILGAGRRGPGWPSAAARPAIDPSPLDGLQVAASPGSGAGRHPRAACRLAGSAMAGRSRVCIEQPAPPDLEDLLVLRHGRDRSVPDLPGSQWTPWPSCWPGSC